MTKQINFAFLESMERFDFAHSYGFGDSFVEFVPKSHLLKEVALAFTRNVRRTQLLGNLPPLLVATAALAQNFDMKAKQHLQIIEGDPRYTRGHTLFDQTLDDIRQRERVRLQKQWEEEMIRGEFAHPLVLGEINLGLMASSIETIRAALDTVLGSMVISAWTALETLGCDAWIAALNEHPAILAELSGRRQRQPRNDSGDPPSQDTVETSEKSIKLFELSKRGYDVSKEMGDVLRARFKWNSLDGIREGYRTAFSRDSREVMAAIEHPSLDALAAARNILVHKAGIVDVEFIGKHKKWPDFVGLANGQILALSGVIVGKILTESIKSGSGLLSAIDSWLVSH